MLKKVIKFLLVIGCMFCIFSFSADNASESTKKSDDVIIKISEFVLRKELTKTEKKNYLERFVVLVRKTAHFSIYLLLGFLLLSLFGEYWNIGYKTIFMVVFLSFLYACSDEFHQLFVPGRSGSMVDVLIDTGGAITGCYLYYFFHKIRRKIHG